LLIIVRFLGKLSVIQILVLLVSKLNYALVTEPLPVNVGFRETRGKTRNEKILDLYLEGWTEAEIGKKLLIAQKTVSNVITDSKKGIDSEITIPDPPQIGDVWLFSGCSE